MKWLEKWSERRRIDALQRRVARLRRETAKAEEEQLARLMPAMETITGRIREERLAVLEKALDRLADAGAEPVPRPHAMAMADDPAEAAPTGSVKPVSKVAFGKG